MTPSPPRERLFDRAPLRRLERGRQEARTQLNVFLEEATNIVFHLANLKDRATQISLSDFQPSTPVGSVARDQSVAPHPPQPPPVQPLQAPVIVIVGPVDRLAEIESLTHQLEEQQSLEVGFRMFSAGVYRIDGYCNDLDALLSWLSNHPEVLTLTREGNTVHVMPSPLLSP